MRQHYLLLVIVGFALLMLTTSAESTCTFNDNDFLDKMIIGNGASALTYSDYDIDFGSGGYNCIRELEDEPILDFSFYHIKTSMACTNESIESNQINCTSTGCFQETTNQTAPIEPAGPIDQTVSNESPIDKYVLATPYLFDSGPQVFYDESSRQDKEDADMFFKLLLHPRVKYPPLFHILDLTHYESYENDILVYNSTGERENSASSTTSPQDSKPFLGGLAEPYLIQNEETLEFCDEHTMNEQQLGDALFDLVKGKNVKDVSYFGSGLNNVNIDLGGYARKYTLKDCSQQELKPKDEPVDTPKVIPESETNWKLVIPILEDTEGVQKTDDILFDMLLFGESALDELNPISFEVLNNVKQIIFDLANNSSKNLNTTVDEIMNNSTMSQTNSTEVITNNTLTENSTTNNTNSEAITNNTLTGENSTLVITNNTTNPEVITNNTLNSIVVITNNTENSTANSITNNTTTKNSTFASNTSNTNILPTCFGSLNCTNGLCIAKDTCKCDHGYIGVKCQFQTYVEECSGTLIRVNAPVIIQNQLFYQSFLVDSKCGKKIVLDSKLLIEHVENIGNRTVQDVITTTVSPKGEYILSIDPSIHNKQEVGKALFVIISVDGYTLNATNKYLHTITKDNEPIGAYVGQSKVLFNDQGDPYAVTSDTTTKSTELYHLDFVNEQAIKMLDMGILNTTSKLLLSGNLVYDPFKNTTTYAFVVTIDEKPALSTVSIGTSPSLETVGIPSQETTVFSIIVSNGDKEQFLISVGTNGTQIESVVPNIASPEVVFNYLDTDTDFTASKIDQLVVDTQNKQVTIINQEESSSIVIDLSAIYAEDPLGGISKMMGEMVSNNMVPVVSEEPVISIDIISFSKYYLPIVGNTIIEMEARLDLSFKNYLNSRLVFYNTNYNQTISQIVKTPIPNIYQFTTLPMEDFPQELLNQKTIQMSVLIEVVDTLDGSILMKVPYNKKQFTVYTNRVSDLTPSRGYSGDEILIEGVYIPEDSFKVKLTNPYGSIEAIVIGEKLSETSGKFIVPNIEADSALLNVQISVENDVYGLKEGEFRYVSPEVASHSASSIFTNFKYIPIIPGVNGTPLIEQIDLLTSRDGTGLYFTLNYSSCSERESLRQMVSSYAPLFDIRNSFSFKVILPKSFNTGNLFEIWFTKTSSIFAALTYDFEKGGRIILNEESAVCHFLWGGTYDIILSSFDEKFTLRIVPTKLGGNVCQVSTIIPISDFENYTISVGQSFNCTNYSVQIPISQNAFVIQDFSSKAPLGTIEQSSDYALALGLGLAGAMIAASLGAVGTGIYLYRRFRKKKFGSYIYYDNQNTGKTLEGLFKQFDQELLEDETRTYSSFSGQYF